MSGVPERFATSGDCGSSCIDSIHDLFFRFDESSCNYRHLYILAELFDNFTENSRHDFNHVRARSTDGVDSGVDGMGIHDEKALNRSQFPFLGVANHGASGADNAVDAQAFEVSDTLSVIADALRQVSVDKISLFAL